MWEEKNAKEGKSSTSMDTEETSAKKQGGELNAEAKGVIRKFVHNISHEGIHNLRMQYNELRAYMPPDFSHEASSNNPTKCRYKDIFCIDKSRVVLKWPPGMQDDFIHANWVTHELFENKFICTQAPLDSTIVDFWRLVWQERVKQILMLCRCEELGKSKCAQYWPLKVDDVMSTTCGITIKCLKVDQSENHFIHSRLQLTYEKEKRFVDHRQWTTWPDKSVPKTPLAPFRLLQYTRKHVKYPSVIHCSAGVGRTGTIVAIEMMYKSLIDGKMPDPPAFLKQLRSQRFLAVQTEDQYVYSHYSIIQFAYAKNWASRHDVKMFCKEYVAYLQLVKNNGGRAPPLNATKPPMECKSCLKLEKAKKDEQEESSGSTSKKKRAARTKKEKERRKTDSPLQSPGVTLVEGGAMPPTPPANPLVIGGICPVPPPCCPAPPMPPPPPTPAQFFMPQAMAPRPPLGPMSQPSPIEPQQQAMPGGGTDIQQQHTGMQYTQLQLQTQNAFEPTQQQTVHPPPQQHQMGGGVGAGGGVPPKVNYTPGNAFTFVNPGDAKKKPQF